MEDKKPKKRSAAYSRTKGHTAEREFAKRFKELGFSFCKTARLASTLTDYSRIDLWGLPFNVQIKSGYEKARPKADQLFKEMKEELCKHFPPGDQMHKFPKILIHKLDSRQPEHELVTMMWSEWVELLKAYIQVNNLK
jgi:hypothetical protein